MIFLAFVGAAIAACSCRITSLGTAVKTGASDVIYVLGTPNDAAKSLQQTKDQEIVTTFDLNNVVYLNKFPVGQKAPSKTTLRIGYAGGWDDCGFDTAPFTWGERAIFALAKSDLDIVAGELLVVPASTPSAPTITAAQYLQTSSALCYPLATSEPGECILESDCRGRGAGFTAFPYTETDQERDNCKKYNAQVKCCGFVEPEGAEITLPTPPTGGVDFKLSGCKASVIKACTGTAATDSLNQCLSATSSRALADAAARLKAATPSIDIANQVTGLSSVLCVGVCKNYGACSENKCICPLPYTGPTCSEKIVPPKMTITAIAPGGTGKDVWMFGTKRPITFTVNNYDPSFDTYYIETTLRNSDENSACDSFSFGPYRETISTLAISKLNPTKAKSFTVKIDWTLGGLGSCLKAGRQWAIEIRGLDVDSKAAKDGPVAVGANFQALYNGCAINGFVGQCMPMNVCAKFEDYVPYTSVTSGTDPCDTGGGTLETSNVCCVPDSTASTAASTTRFRFTSPADSSSSPIYAGSVVPVKWYFDAARGYLTNACSVSATDTFTLEMVAAESWGWGLFGSDSVVASWPGQTPSGGSFSAPIVLIGGARVRDGQKYYFQAKFTASCRPKSREFTLLAPPCQSDTKKTVVGVCVPDADCIEEGKTSDYCAGIRGVNVKCCYKPRSGMSGPFRDADVETLEDGSANAIAASLLALLVAGAAALL